jgi:hypothetical protein
MDNEDISIWKEIHVPAVRVRLLYEFRTKTKLTNFARPSPVVQNRSSHAGWPVTRLPCNIILENKDTQPISHQLVIYDLAATAATEWKPILMKTMLKYSKMLLETTRHPFK